MVVWRLALVVIASVLLAPPEAFPQPPRHGGDRGSPERRGDSNRRMLFFEALREVHHHNSGKEFLDLLYHKPVRIEIKLQEEDFAKLQEYARSAMHVLRDLEKQPHTDNTTKQELISLIGQKLAPLNAQSIQLLQTKSRFDRLIELYAQRSGYSAAANGKVAERIGLVGEDLEKFREARAKLRHQIMEETGRQIQRLLSKSSGDVREQMSRLFENANDRLNESLALELTASQKSMFDKLLENPFADLPKRGPRRRGGPPPHRLGEPSHDNRKHGEKTGGGPGRGRPTPKGPEQAVPERKPGIDCCKNQYPCLPSRSEATEIQHFRKHAQESLVQAVSAG